MRNNSFIASLCDVFNLSKNFSKLPTVSLILKVLIVKSLANAYKNSSKGKNPKYSINREHWQMIQQDAAIKKTRPQYVTLSMTTNFGKVEWQASVNEILNYPVINYHSRNFFICFVINPTSSNSL